MPFLADLTNYKKSGEAFWNRLSLQPVRNDSGAVTHYVGIQSDINAMKRVAEKVCDFAVELGDFLSTSRPAPRCDDVC
jgi:hypothetical protein